MTACPTADDLRALLDDRLAPGCEHDLLAHIDLCAHCQRALETLTSQELPSAVMLARTIRGDLTEGRRPAPEPGAPPDRIGPYRVARELGRGGMGVVYLGSHARLRREAAVKLIRAGVSARPDEVARFRREAEAVSAVAHPNVVAVYEAGEQDGVPWLALEYITGGSLREYLGGRPLPPREAAAIARGLASGAAAVHAAGVVHRDIKPANVLLTPADGGPPVPKLTDFGLAKDLAGGGMTQTGAVLGTPHYMSPEQARIGAAVGPAADIYGIGAVLYEALTGSPPFNGSDPVAVLHLVATSDPVPVRRLQPAVPRDLQTICHKCLEKDPARRYSSAAALAADLGRFLDGRPIRARPIGPVEAGWRLAQRNPALSALAAALVAAVAAGVGGVAWKWREAADERDKTAAAERDTAAERDAAVSARIASARQTALALLDKGIAAAEAGRVGEGLVWMAEALTTAPAEDADLDRVVRTNIAGWLPHAPRARSAVPITAPFERPFALAPDGRSLLARDYKGRLLRVPLEPGASPGVASDFPPRYAAAVSADGRFVLTGTPEKSPPGYLVWDALDRRMVGAPYWPGAEAAAFLAAPVGAAAAVALADGRLLLFDLATARPIFLPLPHPHPEDRVTTMAYAPDGKTLFTWTGGPAGSRCHAWDTATGARSDARFGGPARHAAFSPGGDRLVTVADDGTARLWDVVAGTPVGSSLPSAGQVEQVAFSPDGRYAVLLVASGPARWWDTARGELVAPPTSGPVTWVGFGPGGDTLVTTGHAESVAWVWDLPRPPAASPRLPAQVVDKPPDASVPRTAADPGWTVAVTGGYREAPIVWDVSGDRPGPLPLGLLGRRVSALAASPDGRWLAAATLDRFFYLTEVYVWDAGTGRATARIPHNNLVEGMSFTPDGRVLITGGYEGSVNTWDPATGRRLGVQKSLGGYWATGFGLSPDGRSAAFGRSPGNGLSGPALFAIGPERPAPTIHRVWSDLEGTPAKWFRFSPDGAYVVGYVGSQMSELRRRDARTGQSAGPPLRIYCVRDLALAPDGKTALIASGDGTARMWNLETGEPSGSPLAHASAVNVCALDLRRGLAVCGCEDGAARIWDLATGRALGAPLTHGAHLSAVAFEPDGRSIRTVAADGSARSWAIPQPIGGKASVLKRAVSRRTALALDPGHRVVQLMASEWGALGPAEIPDGGLDPRSWHAARARDAEADAAWAVAAHHLDWLLAAAPAERAALLARRARCCSAAGRFAEASEWYERAAVAAPPVPLVDWYAHRAIESAARGQWKAAAWYIDRLAAARPADPDTTVARAEILDCLGDVDGWAREVIRAAPCAAPADRYWWASRAVALGRWGLGADLIESPGSFLPSPHQQYVAAVARLKAGDSAGYARICKQVEDAVRDDWSADHLNTAAWLLSLSTGGAADPGRLARLLAGAAENAKPAALHVYANTLGAVLIRAGQDDEAVRWLERGIAAEGGKASPEDHALLAIAYRRLGDSARADEALAQARTAADRERLNDYQWPDRAARELLIAEAAAATSPKELAPAPRPKFDGGPAAGVLPKQIGERK